MLCDWLCCVHAINVTRPRVWVTCRWVHEHHTHNSYEHSHMFMYVCALTHVRMDSPACLSIRMCLCISGIPSSHSLTFSCPLGLSTVAPPIHQRPVVPTAVIPLPPGTHLLFAQTGKIERLPLEGNSMKKTDAKTFLHIPVSVG